MLSEKLYALRIAKSLRLTDVHKATGISAASLSAYEKGKYLPSLPQLILLADFYEISLDALLEREPFSG